MSDLKLFRPSWGPGVELCGHYVPSVSSSPNAFRGKRFHETMAALWRKEITLDGVPKDLWEPVDYTYGELSPLFNEAEHMGVEELVPLHDPEFDDFITEGTVDLWGSWTKPNPITVLVDYKTGEERDYWAQLYIYALALIDKLRINQIELILIFADQKRTLRITVVREDLEERVWRIVASASDPRSPHTINRFCDYCDLRFRCPAWENERQIAFKTIHNELRYTDDSRPEHGEQNATLDMARELILAPSFNAILADPNLLGRFIVAYKNMRKLVEKIWEMERRAITQIEQGISIPGVNKVDNPGAEYVDAQEFIKSVSGYVSKDELLAMVKTLDNDKAREVFTALQMTQSKIFGKKTIPVKYTAPSTYLKV